ncbi:hypothetical protein ACIOTI_42095 [Streptomyces sp. NPDC087843]|uniref:hypothetical protein n=1 Tax=Streptomyces sp. NPDC087843 TaxID=3365804 RepID=UPI00381C7AEF
MALAARDAMTGRVGRRVEELQVDHAQLQEAMRSMALPERSRHGSVYGLALGSGCRQPPDDVQVTGTMERPQSPGLALRAKHL